jgi:hypothetical protein
VSINLKNLFTLPEVILGRQNNTLETMLWIRILKDPKLFAVSGSGTCGYGFKFEIIKN